MLPDGCIDVLVHGTTGQSPARVVGTMRRAIVVAPADGMAIGIRFRAGEAPRLLPAASRELTDTDAPLDALWGDDGRQLEEALLGLVEGGERDGLSAEQLLERASATIDGALRKRLASHGEAIDVRVRAAIELLSSGSTVRETAQRVALSERQLARRFADRVGIPPKVFARVVRLQRAAALLFEGSPPSEAALLAGYADQAHFTRESQELAGITPSGLAHELSDSFKTAMPLAS